jgi:23S rRNA (cytidine1920-2'-O)/16S rRNA (cytidine1409-2'-O)-methyltransferase
MHAALSGDGGAIDIAGLIRKNDNKPLHKRKRSRIDDYLVESKIAKDRVHANALVMMGNIHYERGEVVKSATELVDVSKLQKLRSRTRKDKHFVSRAGQKLYATMRQYHSFAKAVQGGVCIDIGASTGGFTDCLLQHKAKQVYSVDVGQNCLDSRIRSNPKVVVVDKCNARYLNSSEIPTEPIFDVVVCDVSSISQKEALPPSLALCKSNAYLCCLIKPQFECDEEYIGEKGIVKDASVREQCVADMQSWLGEWYPEWSVLGTKAMKGHDGGVEYALVAQRRQEALRGQRIHS